MEKDFERLDSHQLDMVIDNYNWDNGFSIPRFIINNSNCEMATAIKIFYLADGFTYLTEHITSDAQWNEFMSELYNKIIKTEFKYGAIKFSIPLTKVQLLKLKKQGVNELFLCDI